MAVVGVYGVMSHSVTQRTSEIGIRVCLWRDGAQHTRHRSQSGTDGDRARPRRRDGCVAGRDANHQQLSLRHHRDRPATFTVVVLTLFVIACVACYVPARRALKVDPVVAMQHD
jgi:putative ABC transport system permease protein